MRNAIYAAARGGLSLLRRYLSTILFSVAFFLWLLVIGLLSNGRELGNTAEEITRANSVTGQAGDNQKKHHINIALFAVIPKHNDENYQIEHCGNSYRNSPREQSAFYKKIKRPIRSCQFNQPQVSRHVSRNN